MWRRFVEPVAADWMLDELNRGSVKELLRTPANESARRHLRASFGAMLTRAHAEEPAWLPEPREHYIPKPPRTGGPPETGSLVLWVPQQHAQVGDRHRGRERAPVLGYQLEAARDLEGVLVRDHSAGRDDANPCARVDPARGPRGG